MRTGDGALAYPLPWASTVETNAIAAPAQYRDALSAAGFEVVSEHNRRDVALDYFARQRAQAATGATALGVQTLDGRAAAPDDPQHDREHSRGPDCAGRGYCATKVMSPTSRLP